ncbi:kelch repeat-containing protein, partial [Rhodocytophaga aerolata]
MTVGMLYGAKQLMLANNSFATSSSGMPGLKGSWLMPVADVSKPIAFLTPSIASTNVSISSNLELEFDEPVFKGSGQIILKYGSNSQTIDVGSNLVSIVNGNKVIINPADFPYSTTIGVVVPATAFRDAANNFFDGTTENNWNFTTHASNRAPVFGSSATSPVFGSSSFTATLPDNVSLGTPAGTGIVTATDPDGDALVYSIVSGNTNGAFAINSSTGALTVNKRLNYHTKSAYSIVVKVTDPQGLTAQATVLLTIVPGILVEDFSAINWTTVASQQYSVSEQQGEVVNGKLYTFGGFDSQKSTFTPTSRSYQFDPVANQWTSIANLPYLPNGIGSDGKTYGGVTHAGITNDGTDIYFAGGYTSNASGTGQIFGTKQVWKYTVGSNTYTRLPDLPVDISAGQMEYVNGKLHHIGGTNVARTEDLASHYVLDLDNLAAGWQTLAPLPNPRQHAGSTVFEGKIYFIGGQNGHDSNLTTRTLVHMYDPATNTWTQRANLPTPTGTNGRGHITSSVVVAGKRIIVLGGETVHSTGRTDMVSAYTPATNTWQNLTPMPAVRSSGVAAFIGGNLYYSGGSTNITFKGVPVPENTNTNTCSPISTLPCPQVVVSLASPFVLEFNTNAGGLLDKNNLGTGFTMVDAPSARLAVDGPVFNSTIPGYEPSRLEVAGGQLKLTSNRGLAFRTPGTSATQSVRTNSQINALGVGVNASAQKLTIETTLVNPVMGTTTGQQAGLWYGLDEDNFVKLVAVDGKIEFRREVNGLSSTASPNPDQQITTAIAAIATSAVKLRLLLDPTTGTIQGFYTVGAGVEVQMGGAGFGFAIPALIAGKTLGSVANISFAGIYTSHRNAGDVNTTLATPPVYSFENFKLEAFTSGTNTLTFTPSSLTFSVPVDGTVTAQKATLSANSGTPAVSLSKSANSNWLVLPANATGELSFGINAAGLAAGTYTATVTASATGYSSAALQVNLTVENQAPVAQTIKINFQDAATVPPTGWLKDYGRPFGPRTTTEQG